MKIESRAELVIIGAGFAGVSTAFHLASSGRRDILLMEKEPLPGMHSSGKNTGFARLVIPDKGILPLVVRSVEWIEELNGSGEVDRPNIYTRKGSLLIGKGERIEEYRSIIDLYEELGVKVSLLSKEDAIRMVPILDKSDFEYAIFSDRDGLIDIDALLHFYLDTAVRKGVRVMFDCEVTGFEIESGGIVSISTKKGVVKAETVVNCAGAWAGWVGRMTRRPNIPLTPCRRHLFMSAPDDSFDQQWPFVFDVTNGIYFRPESRGLLLSPCDAEPSFPDHENEVPGMRESFAEKVITHLPSLRDMRIMRGWSSFRTMTPDMNFVIGFDPYIKNLFWVAGLGGYGVTTSYAVGRLSAAILNGTEESSIDVEIFSPSRFSRSEEDKIDLPL